MGGFGGGEIQWLGGGGRFWRNSGSQSRASRCSGGAVLWRSDSGALLTEAGDNDDDAYFARSGADVPAVGVAAVEWVM